ncbi:MAG: hypothetical protein HKN77_06625 [Woeseiaceae bacterium]|nr:hypothetical protein [Gammaproteobacteria bacterium]NNC77624.1 hypothetical protein [Woeseiaceae bacterium]
MPEIFAVLTAVILLSSCAERSDDGGNFYAGKTISYIVSTDPGGGYDTYARMIGSYLQKYIGADNVIIRNLPGAGHMVGANTLWRSRPDGLTIGTFNAGLVYGQLLGKDGVQFDLRKFEWVGKAAGEPRSIVVSNECSIQSMAELMAATEPVKFGTAGLGSASYSDTMLLADALNLKLITVPGFEGTEGEMSMMRGEICAILGSTSSHQAFVDSGYGHFIVSIGGSIDGVPNAMDLAESERARSLILIIDALAQLGRITAAPPGTPVDRVNALRAAYRQSLEDPALLDEAHRMARPIEPAIGDDVSQLVKAALDQTPETIEMIKKAIDGPNQ